MAFIQCAFKSEALGGETNFYMALPDNFENSKVLYLLHGLSDGHTNWMRYTSVERFVRERGITVIMPDGGRSFYTDMKYGRAYYTYITSELYDYVGKVFKLNQTRENTFVAGLSMGGYGAVKLALRNPDKYGAAASFSGVLDIVSRFDAVNELSGEWKKDIHLICGGEPVKNTDDDLFYLLDKYVSDPEMKKPRIYQACGTEDFLYTDNQRFKEKISHLGFDYKYEEGPGNHNWEFWNEYLPKALDFFENKEKKL